MPNNRTLLRTPLALPVLSLLCERSMHPYEMKIRMRERGHDHVVRARGGSLYDTVERLHRQGFIEATETGREGRRPERTVYAITEAGRDEVQEWLRDLLSRPVNDYPQFVAALSFIGILDQDEWVPLLIHRAAAIEADIAARDAMRAAMAALDLPRIFMIELEFTQAMRRAELKWVRETTKELQDGALGMPSPEVLAALTQASFNRRDVDE